MTDSSLFHKGQNENGSGIAGFALLFSLAGCSSSDQEHANEQARDAVRKSTDEAKKAAHEIKNEAKELSHRIDEAVQPDSESASSKLARAEATARDAATHADAKLDQAGILATIKRNLVSDAGLATLTNVDVEVQGSVVTLSGTVASESQKKAAETAASKVNGVTQVQNRLTVQP